MGGALLLEQFFGIPGVGSITYDAITSGDIPIIKAVVVLTTILFIMVLTFIDFIYAMVDPRIKLQ